MLADRMKHASANARINMRKMNSLTRSLFVAVSLSTAVTTSRAATIWNGPLITYTQPGTDPTLPANQDPLTSHVIITRAVNQGIFNAVSESFYTHDFSPADTEWAVGDLAN